MKTIAILVTHDYYPSRPDRADPDYAEDQLRLMSAALEPLGVRLEPVFWQDHRDDWSAFDAVMPLLAWNYPREVDTFLACLDQIEASGTLLLNDGATICGNMDKIYLAELADRGAPVPPTQVLPDLSPRRIYDCFSRFAADEIIIKPRIGAGAWRQVRLKRGESLPAADLLPPEGILVQPFLPAVTQEGEMSLLYFGGEFSHALVKVPKKGDYRTQGQFGATELGLTPPDDAKAAAQAVLAKADGAPFTYARVDLVRGHGGEWLLMELELIEPWLYLAHDGHGGTHGAALLARTIHQRLEERAITPRHS
jgi:glutathione synthase/RimK-type ligase-like ATP-grasp enzyme